MARRKSSGDEGGVSLDSLMDALTNVVAVLILVLILVQADVVQKVEKFIEGLDPATPAEVATSARRLEDLRKEQAQLERRLKEDAPSLETVEAEKRQLALLDKSLEENKDLLANLEELKKLEEHLRTEHGKESKATASIQEEIARLEARLDTTAKLAVTEPTVVSIPQSRPIPPNATVYRALVLKNRVHFIDTVTPLELFDAEFRRHKNDWRRERVKRQGADEIIYDQEKIARHFENFDFKNTRKQKVRLEVRPANDALFISVSPDQQEGGTGVEELKEKKGAFPGILKRLAGDRKAVVIFQVAPDSFNSYLLARELTDLAGIPAGWEINPGGSHWLRVPNIKVNRLKEPEPPAKSDNKPPKLEPKLD